MLKTGQAVLTALLKILLDRKQITGEVYDRAVAAVQAAEVPVFFRSQEEVYGDSENQGGNEPGQIGL